MVEDSKLYSASKEFVVKNFSDYYNKTEEVLILSISRKGPKFLEYLLGRKDYPVYNTITEVALPFCLERMAQKKDNLLIKVFDDAVYYGTTVEGIIHELEDYEKIYGITSRKELYTAIRAKESHSNFNKNLNDVDIHSYNDDYEITLRPGYGHFFIRSLSEELGNAGNTMEIEFPIVEFESRSEINAEGLVKAFRLVYGDERVIVVENEKKKNFSIVLDEYEGQAFNKIRVYLDGRIVRIVVMSPWLLPNDVTILIGLFNMSPFFDIWEQLTNTYTHPQTRRKSVNAYSFMHVERSIRKSLVIMANYLLSYGQFLSERDRIRKAFIQFDSEIAFNGLKTIDLFYLLGDQTLCDIVKKRLNDAWLSMSDDEIKWISKPNIRPLRDILDYQVFENEDFPGEEEYAVFERHNHAMIKKCINENEELSSLFFNQTALIEKWSRRSEVYDFGRLRFGYTFPALIKYLHDSGFAGRTMKSKVNVHRWVDHRIDQACVVPQYVVDSRTNLWCRVFRPGENEDALLSHLSRYVLALYGYIDDVQKLGWIWKNLFRELLCYSVLCIERDDFWKTFEFALIPDTNKRELYFAYGGNGDQRSVLNYMIDMNILKEDNEMLTISNELVDDDLMNATTLDNKIEMFIKDRLTSIMDLIVKLKYQEYPFFVTNFFFFKKEDIEMIKILNNSMRESLNKAIEMIESRTKKEQLASFIYNNYMMSQKFIVSIDIFTNEKMLALLFSDEQEKNRYINEMTDMWIAKFTFELLIITQLQNDSQLLKRELKYGSSYEIHGKKLEWSEDLKHFFIDLVGSTDDIMEISVKSLPVIKERIRNIQS